MLLISADADHKDAIKLTLTEQCLNALKILLRRDQVGMTASAQNYHTEEHLLSQAVAEIIQSTCRKNMRAFGAVSPTVLQERSKAVVHFFNG